MKAALHLKLVFGSSLITFLLLKSGAQGIGPTLPLYLQPDLTLPLVDGSIRFAVLGNTDPELRLQYETLQRLKDFHLKFPFQFMLMIGDDDRSNSASPVEMDRISQLLHDLSSSGVEFFLSPGRQQQWREISGQGDQENRRYYSFKRGPVHFFALDTDNLDVEQISWLKLGLKESRHLWKICLLERPLPMLSESQSVKGINHIRELLESLFTSHGVHVVFSGSGHPYKRLHPLKGTYHFISGATYIPSNGPQFDEDLVASRFDRDLSFLLVEISGDVLYFESVSRKGETIDRSALPRLHPERWHGAR